MVEVEAYTKKSYHRKGYHRKAFTVHRHGKTIHIPATQVKACRVGTTHVKAHKAKVWHLTKNQKAVNPHAGREKR